MSRKSSADPPGARFPFSYVSRRLGLDIKIEPESDRLLRAIVDLKDRLQLNVELAAPDHFIPPLPGWEARSARSFRLRVEEVAREGEAV